jgi:hypothetical protein
MLRGAQTVSELRANCERLYRFNDVSSVEGYLEELATRPSGTLVLKLPKQPGEREHRWAHLLCGAVTVAESGARRNVGGGDNGALEERLARLEQEVADLRAELAQLAAGVAGKSTE